MTKKVIKIMLLIITILFLFMFIFISGWKMFFGFQKSKVEFSDLSTNQQTEINKSIEVLIGIEPNVETITYTVYKNGVSNYNIKFNITGITNLNRDNLPELDESSSLTNVTGYYFKDNDLYLIIDERNYSELIGKENIDYSDKTLKELNNLMEIFQEINRN